MTITRTFQKQIIDQLNYQYLNSDDFDMEIYEKENCPCVLIKYRYEEIYFYLITIDNGGGYSIERSPGEVSIKVTYKIKSLSNLPSDIQDWLYHLEKEISASPVVRNFFNMKLEIDNQLADIEEMISGEEEKYFSRLESEELLKKLNNLEGMFLKHLEKEHQDTDKLQVELEKFKKEVEFLKNQLEFNTRKNWILAFSAKFLRWGKNNPKTIKAIGGMVNEFLPENGPKNVVNDLIEIALINESNLNED